MESDGFRHHSDSHRIAILIYLQRLASSWLTMQSKAILFDSSANRNQAQLNISLTVTIAVCIVFLFLSMSFGETLSDESNVENADEWWDVPLNERHEMELPMNTSRAQLPVQGKFKPLPYEEHFITVDYQHLNRTLDILTKQKCMWLCGFQIR